VLRDEQGKTIPVQILGVTEDTCEIAFWADAIPAFGYKTFVMDFTGGHPLSEFPNIGHEKDEVLENKFLRIKIHENGSLTILDKRNRTVLKGQNIVEDTADRGDTYNYDPIHGDRPVTTKGANGKIYQKENGPFQATYDVKTKLVLPESLVAGRKARKKKRVNLPIIFSITLKKDSPLVSITARIDNRVKDHRLRVLFPGIKSRFVFVQTQGDVVKRPVKESMDYPPSRKRDIAHHTSVGALPKEIRLSPTQFQRNFVGLNDGKKGVVILNKGLPEYEAKPDGTIALTLLRSVGWLSRGDLTTRERLAGPKVPVPDAQCLGQHTFEYAILPQSGSWEASPIYQEENQYSIPIKYLDMPGQSGELPARLSFIQIKPDQLMVSAIKKAYSNDNLIIRLFNPTGKTVKGNLKIFPGITKAWLADLNEEKQAKIPVRSNGSIPLNVKPKKIVTVSVNT